MKRVVSYGSFLSAVTAGLLLSGTAAADDPPPPLPPAPSTSESAAVAVAATTIDNVHLRNGGLYRGRVTEIVPGDHVTVIVEQGETKRVPWAEVDRVIVASSALPPPPVAPGAAAAATPPLLAPMVGPRARVHLRSSKNVILYRRPAGSGGWVQACTSPCNQELPIGDSYRVTGNGVASSSEFRLEAPPGGAVDIAIDPPSTGGMVAGGFLAGGGVTAAYVGLLMALVGVAQSINYTDCTLDRSSHCEDRRRDGDEVRNAGLITLGVGAALTLGGILIFISSAKTDIAQSSSSGGGSARASRPLDAFQRQPTWRSASSSSERASTTPPAAFPVLFQGSF